MSVMTAVTLINIDMICRNIKENILPKKKNVDFVTIPELKLISKHIDDNITRNTTQDALYV